MKSPRILFLLACSLLVPPLFAQQTIEEKSGRYVTVPADVVLLVIASQPDCPLLIESARVLRSLEGDSPGFYSYQLRNIGTKPIIGYTLSVWNTDAAGSTLNPVTLAGELVPNQTMRYPFLHQEPDLVPMSNELRQKLGFDVPLRFVAVIMVEHVRFSDGSSYDDDKLSSVVQEYFLKINGFRTTEKAPRSRHRNKRRGARRSQPLFKQNVSS